MSRAPHYRTRQTTRRQERQERPYPPAASQMGAAIARGMKQVKSADGNGNFEQVNTKLNLFCTNPPCSVRHRRREWVWVPGDSKPPPASEGGHGAGPATRREGRAGELTSASAY